MNDSIERIREDAEKHYTDYWGCNDHDGCELCPSCGVATTRVWHNKTMIAKTGEDITRDLAVELAVVLWNEREGDE